MQGVIRRPTLLDWAAMDKIVEKFRQMTWRYAPQDPGGCAELRARLAESGRRGSLTTYSELVRGITFSLPSLRLPEHRIDTAEWQDLDRVIVGDFLGFLSMESYEQAGFFCSALAVSRRPALQPRASSQC
jgi:hypothetical protein